MMSSLIGAKWLLKGHAVNVTGGPAVANAFETPQAGVGSAALWAVMLGGNQTTATLSVAYLPAGSGSVKFEVLHPGPSVDWTPLPGSEVRKGDEVSAVLTVPLAQGCAMVRVAK